MTKEERMENNFYIARNNDGWLCLFKGAEPKRDYVREVWTGEHCIGVLDTERLIFSNLTWRDNPVLVDIKEKDKQI